MKESVGGSSLLNLVIIFAGLVIAVFVGILSYTKAYRIKNRIIEIIEKYEKYDANVVKEINPDLNAAGYNLSNPSRCANIKSRLISDENGRYNAEHISDNMNKNNGYNYCVFEICEKDEETKVCSNSGKHYLVVTFIHFEFPIIGDMLTFPVYGETKMLGKDYNY